ncbi:MAG: hypothetical protein MI923_10600 [Phycisphaerales bacterium]|nr:hypothetical protein [Phycisphaerales bacterium]
MHHHHHIDEFSVTDIRHTLNEVWRVICARRWFLVLPFCIMTAIACLCSLWIPRQYTTSTIIKREHDPVFANLMGKSWTQPYRDIRERMPSEIKNEKFIEGVLESEGIPDQRDSVNTTFFAMEQSRGSLVKKMMAGLSVKTVESTETRDIVRIDLTMDDSKNLPHLLRIVRDAYMQSTRKQTVEILVSVSRFLQSESDRCRRELEQLNNRLVEYELKYPGVNPNAADPASAEKSALMIERLDLEKKLDDLVLKENRLQVELAALVPDPKDENADSMMLEEPNPRYGEIIAEIERLEMKIAESKTMRSMTDAHPEIQRTRALLAMRRETLEKTPATLTVSARVVGKRAVNFTAADQIRKRLSDIEISKATLDNRLRDIQLRVAALSSRRAAAIEHRQEYVRLRHDADRLGRELATWQQNIVPIQQVLNLEDKNRSIHFATVQGVASVVKPSSPDSKLVMLFCLGIGFAAAVLSVLLVELIDRSYRSVKQLTSSLGIPVIESIDEIMTKVVYRRRLIRNLVVMPTLAMVTVTAMVVAGTMAYMSLENPEKLESLKLSPHHLYEFVLGWS